MKNYSKIATRLNIIKSFVIGETSIKCILYLKQLPLYLILLSLIAIICYLTDKWLEVLFQIVAFLFLRYKYDTTYHAKTTARCMFITISVIVLALPNVPSFNISLFGCILQSFLITFISWYIQYVIDLKKEKNKIIEKQFNINNCSEEEFINRCKVCGLNKINLDIALHYFYYKDQDLYDISDKYCIEYESAKQKVWRIKKKIT